MKRYRQFNLKHDLTIPVTFELGDQFADFNSFKRALKMHAVQNGFDYNYKHNDMSRVSAVCKAEQCSWRIHASTDATRTCFQIKTYYPVHICRNQYENSRCDVEYLVRTYQKDFKDDPTWAPYALKQRVKRDLNIDVPIDRCYRAKREALNQLFGSHSKQYRLTQRYTLAILSTKPGSSAYVHRDGALFQRMYICLDAFKKGFRHGCRPIICLDACHLNGQYGGQLLCAIGKDGNDDMFPIAIDVAEAEATDSWKWFITILLEDLCGPEGGLGWTIMSDRQKGLGTAVEVVLPHAEHRFCVRHLHANLKAKGYTGKAMKDQLWGAAYAANVYAFDHHMQNILSMEKGVHDYLSGVPKASWSRHAFSCQIKSDMLLNNLAESFNAWIKEVRSKPILTILEEIRLQIMARFQQKRNGIWSTHYTICPKIQKKLERSKSDARNCISRWQNELEFEIEHIYEPRRLVQLDHHTCTCGRWQVSGIPCSHACATIYMHKQKPEDYLDDYYKMDKYMQGYAVRVYGMEGPQTWPADDPRDQILPPCIRRAPGRPKISR
ncbi:uncharacterized protein LOC132190770 [Corylus avellana]|uniref:uncharacterized protein LOC132190770 n=1 Tax=Corylus avellana TaxID=13451 RepID=UPI00286D106C|nr:uncharacterized protein LOC132190770 [Corylus avellana]